MIELIQKQDIILINQRMNNKSKLTRNKNDNIHKNEAQEIKWSNGH